MRVRHDMLGCSNRLRQTASRFRESVEAVMETWRDSRAEKFQREDLKDIDTVVDRLVSQLQEASEKVAHFDHQLRDDYEEV